MSTRENQETEAAHDILAAEAFGVPAADPDLQHGPVVLPEDPTGIAEAHDVLAAEQFAMPAPQHHHDTGLARRTAPRRGIVQAGAAVAVALLLLRRLRRRRRGS